jgi:hypothetical protein
VRTVEPVLGERELHGSPDVLELKDIDKPLVKDDEVLVRVLAASVNHGLRPIAVWSAS